MGKLVRLEIYNFKSYRGRHTLLFGDSYFTSIIGPNGSGKSNSMDAISFVLGLQDMVYRGRIIREARINADGTATEGDAASNGATQENGDTQSSTQTENPQNAWVKARTITAAGASEYRINRRQEHSILVKARNFLVFQGDVEKIATMASDKLTEQADYDRLKAESEAATEDNAKHLHERRGINGELKTYQEQKAEADEYERKLAERDEAVVTKTLWKLFLYRQTMEQARDKIASHQEELKEHKRSERQAEAKVKRDEKQIEDTTNELAPIEMKIRLLNDQRQKNDSQVQKVQKDLDLVQRAEQKWEDDFRAASQRQGRELSQQDLQEYNQLRGEVIDRLKREVDTDRDHAAERLSAERSQLKELESARNSKQKELDKLRSDRRQLELTYREKNQMLQESATQLSIIEGSRRESRKQQEARKAIERLRVRLGPEKVHGRYRDLFTAKQAKYRKAMGRVFGPQMETVIVDTEATAKECIAYLKQERIGIMSFDPLDSIQIKAVDSQLKGMHKGMRLAIDCINYEPKHERAMTAACGNTMVCDTEKIAKELRYERRVQAKAVTLDGRVISKGGTQTGGELDRDDDGGEQSWDEKSYQTLRDRVDSLQKELANLPKLESSRQQEQAIEAELLDLTDQVRRAQDETKALTRNIDSLKKELTHHKSELRGVRPNFEQQTQRLRNREAELQGFQDSVNQVSDSVFAAFCQRLGYASIRDYEDQQGTVQQEAAEKRLEFTRQRSKLSFLLKQLESSLQGIEDRLSGAEAAIKRVDVDLAEQQEKQEELQNSRDVLQAELEELQEKYEALEEKLTERALAVREARRALDHRNEKVKHVLRAVDSEEAKIKTSATSRYNTLKECRVNEIKIPLKPDSKTLTSLPMTDLPRPDADAMDVDEDVDNTQIQQPEIDDYGIDVDFDELDEDLQTELLSLLATDTESTAPSTLHTSLATIESRLADTITRLDTDISKATPNMRAGERLASTTARLAAIDASFAQTRTRAAAAKRAFDATKQRRHTLFMKAFTHISSTIGATYKALTKSPQFPLGGTAYLDMEDSSEPYLAGLKYHAMPPLKRFRDMEHLSGGEKTIAALALLFAIHSYQPSPFFVLDEVDAALDNVNVARVAAYVREHAGPGMQFVVISLKAGFFQESEALVGVLRDQSAMSSRYLSLDLRKYAA
ncbi:RecF/RecN/SMC [Boeremia exigua]|uniref:RecF/RecN/SMC n=1 Tax=Boeremia exigua TaxID=749465 RepID=UPI001E8E3A3D|nr:RecF/RecN/SMC [Boeremia exigua]KAH6620492.1 RecF/RecN/SMC [Boeremia exigua]